jgi:hypothetical protein
MEMNGERYKKTMLIAAGLSPSVRMTGNVPAPNGKGKDLKFHWKVVAEVFFLEENRFEVRFVKSQKLFGTTPLPSGKGGKNGADPRAETEVQVRRIHRLRLNYYYKDC